MLHRILAVAMLAAVLGCTDRAPVTEPDGGVPAAASLASLSKRPEALAKIVEQAKAAIELEIYLPVPAHRAAWTGDENILVATALTDDDPPIAFDPTGRRHVLDPETPPVTPVLGVVSVETDFSSIPSRVEECIVDCSGGGGGTIGDVE